MVACLCVCVCECVREIDCVCALSVTGLSWLSPFSLYLLIALLFAYWRAWPDI